VAGGIAGRTKVGQGLPQKKKKDKKREIGLGIERIQESQTKANNTTSSNGGVPSLQEWVRGIGKRKIRRRGRLRGVSH